MDNARRNRVILTVSLAVLLPLAIQQVAYMVGRNGGPNAGKQAFYGTTIVGAAAIVAGMKLAVPVLSAGLFYGGIVTIAKNYYDNWNVLPLHIRLWTLLLALAIIIGLCLHKAGKLGLKRQKAKAAPVKRKRKAA